MRKYVFGDKYVRKETKAYAESITRQMREKICEN